MCARLCVCPSSKRCMCLLKDVFVCVRMCVSARDGDRRAEFRNEKLKSVAETEKAGVIWSH